MGNDMENLWAMKKYSLNNSTVKIGSLNGLYAMPIEASMLLHASIANEKQSNIYSKILFPHLVNSNYSS